jgi:hypothetical protein
MIGVGGVGLIFVLGATFKLDRAGWLGPRHKDLSGTQIPRLAYSILARSKLTATPEVKSLLWWLAALPTINQRSTLQQGETTQVGDV